MGCEASRVGGGADPKRCKRRVAGCGHRCGGVRGEAPGPGCTAGGGSGAFIGCREKGCAHYVGGACPVCLGELDEEPAVRLGCGHAVHFACARDMLRAVDWRGRLIRPAAIRCPAGCGRAVDHPLLRRQAGALAATAGRAGAAARAQAQADGTDVAQAEARYACFQCYKCRDPFCGGLRECAAAGDDEPMAEPRTVICGACRQRAGRAQTGLAKCDWCCKPATFECGGGAFFCDRCHTPPYHWEGSGAGSTRWACDPASCAFGGRHPAGRTRGWRLPLGTAPAAGRVTLGVGGLRGDVARLAGTYAALPGEVRGAPWWRREGGGAWLLSGGDGRWLFTADPAAAGGGAGAPAGTVLASTAPHSGASPDDAAVEWGPGVCVISGAPPPVPPPPAPAAAPPAQQGQDRQEGQGAEKRKKEKKEKNEKKEKRGKKEKSEKKEKKNKKEGKSQEDWQEWEKRVGIYQQANMEHDKPAWLPAPYPEEPGHRHRSPSRPKTEKKTKKRKEKKDRDVKMDRRRRGTSADLAPVGIMVTPKSAADDLFHSPRVHAPPILVAPASP